MKKIAITQRLIENTSYFEIRDCLDTNWTTLFKALNIIPIILPTNYPIENFINNGINIDGLILSGGNDLNAFNSNMLSEQRDSYELELVAFFVKNKIPILGICRGMQLLSHHFGATFEINKKHAGSRHKLIAEENSKYYSILKEIKEVNSYHNYCIKEISDKFEISAKSEDNLIEAIEHKELPIFAQMWHSEREKDFNEFELAIFRKVFDL